MHIPNIRHLRVFREVAHCGSVSLAAEREHLSQPAVTQAIAGLEEDFGVSLFERRSDGMHVTAIGAVYLGRAEKALQFLKSGADEALRFGLRQKGRGFQGFHRMLTVAQLRALTAMSQANNFTIAARNIGISQPSIHRAARNLEKLCGMTLFVSAPEGIMLTQSALALAQHANLAFAELKQGFDEIQAHLGRDSSRILVGSTPLPRTYILPKAIDDMVKSTQAVQIQVIDGPYGELLGRLRNGEIDFLIGALRDPVPINDVEQIPLFDDPLAIVAGKNHPLAGKKKVTLEETLAYPWVAPPKPTPAGSYLFDVLKIGEREETPVRVVTSSLVLVRELLTAGDYITIISLHQIRHERDYDLLVPLPVVLEHSERAIGLTVRRGWRATPAQAKFIDFIKKSSENGHLYDMARGDYSKNQ
ncbi:LysR family transcriptional regulator [Rhizobium sp. L1K21]|uniref:LysR family transcriptional regulator n=1 Tax=Rhizobium sp. L1K21 TaxID=2954933 RepID=UPI0020922F78|nr:LysR family transcriptional regulator [Rhizobium sp. L1K21]MCO6184729.1 LysR family transcriptional regulator [Rhizobium sp. L1K21]